MTAPHEYETVLLALAADHLLPPGALDDPARRATALGLLREGYQALAPRFRSVLRRAADLEPGHPPSPRLIGLLRSVLGWVGLHHWAAREEPAELARLGAAGALAGWLSEPPIAGSDELLGAGLREALGMAHQQDKETIRARLGQLLRRGTMAITYDFDPRSRPLGFNEQHFRDRVDDQIKKTIPNPQQSIFFVVYGAMSLDGFLSQDDLSQDRHVRELRFEAENTTKKLDGGQLLNREAYELIFKEIEVIRSASTNGAGPPGAYFEELAFVARDLISNAVLVPIDANGLRERVANALNKYVPGQSGGTLNLPSLAEQEGVNADLVSDNIRAVALVYAAWNLEELKLLPVLDRVVEVFMNGQLPVGFDNGGRALSDYYFEDDEQRLTEAARRMTYSRVLGVPGGEVSKEAPPNRLFESLFLRFLASVSEYDRQRRIADVVGGRPRNDVLSLTGEQVRKAGRDLAANVTLFGYGGTFFVAQRLARQIEQSLRILSVPEILAAYGVQGPFQVVERVCASDFGGVVPNIVRYRTMAEAGKGILDIVAAHVPAWLGQSGQDLFEDPFDNTFEGPSKADIPREVEQRLLRFVEHWLTVNGIKDDQRAQLGEPQITMPAPSIPRAAQDGAGSAAFDQLRQMVSAGQTPSLDQIKALLPDVGGMVRM